MTTDIKNVVDQLHQSGLNLELKADGKLAVSPSNCLNEALRGLIRDNKEALVNWAKERRACQLAFPKPDSTRQLAKLAISQTTETAFLSMLDKQLLAVAMLICDQENDNLQARDDMRRDCLEAPESLKADVLAYLRSRVHDKKKLQAPTPPPPPSRLKIQPSEEWKVLSRAYHAHHFKCPVCIASGRGARYGLRCGAGTALWAAYEDSTEDTPRFTKVHKGFTKSTTSPHPKTGTSQQ